jgi:hypothetical protein
MATTDEARARENDYRRKLLSDPVRRSEKRAYLREYQSEWKYRPEVYERQRIARRDHQARPDVRASKKDRNASPKVRESKVAWNRRAIKDPHHRERMLARKAVWYAKRTGKLVQQPCEKYGSSESQAHHHNGYAREHRLDVSWLCRKCHVDEHFEERTAELAEFLSRRKVG